MAIRCDREQEWNSCSKESSEARDRCEVIAERAERARVALEALGAEVVVHWIGGRCYITATAEVRDQHEQA